MDSGVNILFVMTMRLVFLRLFTICEQFAVPQFQQLCFCTLDLCKKKSTLEHT